MSEHLFWPEEFGPYPECALRVREVRLSKLFTFSEWEDEISRTFREGFKSHPARASDPGLALVSALETASAMVPLGTYGSFDDENLTFEFDVAT